MLHAEVVSRFGVKRRDAIAFVAPELQRPAFARISVNQPLLLSCKDRGGLTKESAVPATDIKQAITRKAAFTANPAAHTFKGEFHDA